MNLELQALRFYFYHESQHLLQATQELIEISYCIDWWEVASIKCSLSDKLSNTPALEREIFNVAAILRSSIILETH